MTTISFKCARTGEQLSPERAGHCALCKRLLNRKFLREVIYAEQKAPICIDCVAMVARYGPSEVSDEKFGELLPSFRDLGDDKSR
jgi:hypothetical protein